MFIIENGKITGEKTLDIGKIRVINLVFKSDLAFADDDRFKLVLGSIQSENYAFVDDGCLRFSYVDVADVIKSQSANFAVQILHNGVQILSDSITITAYVQGGGSSDVQGIVYNNNPRNVTEVKIIPSDFTKDWTDFSNMFSGCQALTSISPLDTSNGTSFNSMFYNCRALISIPQIDTSNGTDFYGMFSNCRALISIPQLDTSNGTNFSNMFSGSYALTSILPLDTSNGTNFSYMFSSCRALTSIPQIDTSNGTDFCYMFGNCFALTSIPQLDTSNGTNFSYMFVNCPALTSIPQIDTSNGTDFSSMFSSSYTLTSIPQLDVSNGIYFSDMFNSCSDLIDFGGLLNVKYSFDLSYSFQLTHQSLLNVLNGLYDLTGSTSQTLTLGSDNLAKLTDEEKAIATNKNWVLA